MSLDSKTGYDFGGLVGYNFGPLRLEAEAGLWSADIDSLQSSNVLLRTNATGNTSGTFISGGDTSALSFMLNGVMTWVTREAPRSLLLGRAG